MTLRVSALDGTVTLTLPKGAPEAAGLAFAEERRDWIANARAEVEPVSDVGPGTILSVEGAPVSIELYDGRAPVLEDGVLRLPRKAPARQAVAFLKVLARDRLTAACDVSAARLGVSYTALTLRDTRSRWGSCTTAGRLMFSWRLAMAPPEVLFYVAAHEVAHLVHMDHSKAFWGVVGDICPDWQTHRNWLRTDGRRLHALRFDA